MRNSTSFLRRCLAATGALLLATSVAGAAWTPEQQCAAAHNKAAGKYVACRHNAEAKLVTGGDPGKYSEARGKCNAKWVSSFDKAVYKYDNSFCVDVNSYLLRDDFEELMDRQTDAFATAFEEGSLVRYTFPPTGQTTSYGAGSDGQVRAGGLLGYRNNWDGTITDENTGLMWEKKSDDGSIHDHDNSYTWCKDTVAPIGTCDNGTNYMDGTIVTTFLAGLNSGLGFANHTDWRIPNVKELQSIVNYQVAYPGPVVSSDFNTSCAASCTVLTCICTAAYFYWSSTSYADFPFGAWFVSFDAGYVDAGSKYGSTHVRAVRGGS